MKTSVAGRLPLKLYGVEGGIKLLADAGFEAVDYPLYMAAITPWDEGFFKDPFDPDFKKYFKDTAEVIARHGMELYQSHAPYLYPNRSDPKEYAMLLEKVIRSIYASGYMDCPNTVTHPVLHPDFHNGQNRERAIRTNVEFFGAMVPALKETGVTMCIENLFWGDRDQPKTANACSDGGQLACLIDTLNDLYGPHFAACLDTGHAAVSGNDPCRMIRELGHRVRVLHLQDNKGVMDDHMMPGMGVVNWPEFLSAMREIGYSGTFNFEVYFNDYEKDIYNKAVHQAACELLCHIGRSLADIVEGIPGVR